MQNSKIFPVYKKQPMNQSINHGLSPIIVVCLLLFAVSANAAVKTLPIISQHYDYDAGGNRTFKSHNGATTAYLPETTGNRLDTVNTRAYRYDATGNLAGNGAYTFGYDSRNRLTYAKASSGAEYRYGINAIGQRVGKTSAALTTGGRVFVHDEAGHLIGEYDTAGARIQEHLWLGDQPVAVIAGKGGLYYVLGDHLNTPRQIVDGSNRLRWRWDNLDPFGVNAPNTNPQGLGVFGYNPRFPGQYADSETGLFYNYFRIYDQKGGRFTQSDPIGLRGGLNTYSYVGNNPLRYTDPTGLYAQVLVGYCRLFPAQCATAVAATAAAANSCINNTNKMFNEGISPEIDPKEVAGKSPSQIDKIAKDKGLIPKGDPEAGNGAYIDPVTGKQRILTHPEPDSGCSGPHCHVNNPAGERLDINGNVVPSNSPDAHLPLNYP